MLTYCVKFPSFRQLYFYFFKGDDAFSSSLVSLKLSAAKARKAVAGKNAESVGEVATKYKEYLRVLEVSISKMELQLMQQKGLGANTFIIQTEPSDPEQPQDAVAKSSSWSCSACTYENPSTATSCEMCGSSCPSASPTSLSETFSQGAKEEGAKHGLKGPPGRALEKLGELVTLRRKAMLGLLSVLADGQNSTEALAILEAEPLPFSSKGGAENKMKTDFGTGIWGQAGDALFVFDVLLLRVLTATKSSPGKFQLAWEVLASARQFVLSHYCSRALKDFPQGQQALLVRLCQASFEVAAQQAENSSIADSHMRKAKGYLLKTVFFAPSMLVLWNRLAHALLGKLCIGVRNRKPPPMLCLILLRQHYRTWRPTDLFRNAPLVALNMELIVCLFCLGCVPQFPPFTHLHLIQKQFTANGLK